MGYNRWPATALGLALAACEPSAPPLLEPSLRGVVTLDAPLAGARLTLHALAPDGALGPRLAEARTDTAGAFALSVPTGRGDYAVRAAFTPEDTLSALVVDLRDGEARELAITPVTTWTAALVEGFAAAGVAAPVTRARRAARDHLGFDAEAAPLAPASGAGDASHRLLVDALGTLSESLAGRADATVSSLPALLRALVADAALGPIPGLMDGLGADGAVGLPAEALRADWASAAARTLAEDAGWAGSPLGAYRALLARLRCSPSEAFGACAPDPGGGDVTPPQIDLEAPADSPIEDTFVVEVAASDGESGVSDVQVVWATDLDSTPRPLVDLEPSPERARGRVDASGVPGRRVWLEVTATNGAQVTTTRRFTRERATAARRTLTGDVFKGPADGVLVEAFGVDLMLESPLASARSTSDGRFALEVAGYEGPLRVTARGASDGTSGFLDESSPDAPAVWEASDALSALVPAGREAEHVVITPWTDLALARASALSPDPARPEVAAYADTLTALLARFDVPEPARLRPTWPPTATHAPPSASDRALLSLACLSEQARRWAPSLSSALGRPSTVFDLVRLYHRDALDGVWDGRDGAEPLPLPENALRADLARACVAWLSRAETSLRVEDVVQGLAERVALDTSALFDPDQVPEALDDSGPVVAPLSVSPLDGQVIEGRVRGALLVSVFASDPSGVATLELEASGAVALEALPVSGAGARAWRVDTRGAPDGPLSLTARATDTLGHLSERRLALVVDNTAPGVAATLDGAPLAAEQATTRDPAQLTLALSEDGAPRVRLDDIEVEVYPAPDAPRTWHADLTFFGRERTALLSFEAADALGNATETVVAQVRFDATPPEVLVVPTGFVDERGLDTWPLPESLEGRPRVDVSEATLAGESLEVARWINRWRDDVAPANPVRLAWRAVDAGPVALSARWAFETCAAVEVAALEGQALLGASTPLSPLPEGVGGPQEAVALSLDAAALGFDPLDPLAPARRPLCVQVEAADEVGLVTTARWGLTLVRVAPALEVVQLAPADVPAPRLSDLDALSLAPLVEAGGAVNVAALAVRNPHPNLDLIAQVVAPAVGVVAERAPIEVAQAERVGGFMLPACFEAWGGAAPPFLTIVGAEWRCAARTPLAEVVERAPGAVEVWLGGARLPSGALSLRGRVNAVAQTLVVALAPGNATAETRALAAASAPEPLLSNVAFARVVQGPGRVATRPAGCVAPSAECVRWAPLTRGERLTRVATELGPGAWRLRARFGREVTLDQPLTAPTDREVRLR